MLFSYQFAIKKQQPKTKENTHTKKTRMARRRTNNTRLMAGREHSDSNNIKTVRISMKG